MSKQYGLILPGQKKAPNPAPRSSEGLKPSVFDESSESEEDNAPPHLKMKKTPLGPGLMERRMARSIQEKALEEDPTVFQYDELYDDMENKRENEKDIKKREPKKSKYITRLLEVAERRKLENELRIERQVQKEREAEGEEFKDKEIFVTAAYRSKLEEMRKLEESEKRDEYLEDIGDVKKQKNIDGFYRYLYEQKTEKTEPKEVQKPTLPEVSSNDNEMEYKPIKSNKSQRTYRKRHSSDDDDADVKEKDAPISETKKMHLQNNIDADSDFSIDSSSDDDEGRDDLPNKKMKKTNDIKNEKNKEKLSPKIKIDSTKLALKLDKLRKEDDEPETKSIENEDNKTVTDMIFTKEIKETKPKIDKSEIWKKRTVGDVFDAAVQRYFERKAAKSG
ncbi:nuclear speckle splicing regulatory protein 1-like [Teleopsis dalmanni]|uniref:nuclear speckle splicing regulatory protein 1-like n=1 Tax=Teleopsis dalmanni TaxID=139649 RepID=UPI0018CF6A0C|nr:nuclear speckle splicing regulatory protein 1-like [Teleopsis dalmanni]